MKTKIIISMIVVGFLAIGLTDAISQISSSDTTRTSESVTIEAKGPGALYIARLNDGIGVWVINGDKITPAGTVNFAKGKRIPTRWRPNLSNGIRAIFYEDNLPLDVVSNLSFSGNIENRDCPDCTVIMPLSLQTPVERRDKKYYEQILSFENQLIKRAADYETLGKQMEDIYMKRIERRPRPTPRN